MSFFLNKCFEIYLLGRPCQIIHTANSLIILNSKTHEKYKQNNLLIKCTSRLGSKSFSQLNISGHLYFYGPGLISASYRPVTIFIGGIVDFNLFFFGFGFGLFFNKCNQI